MRAVKFPLHLWQDPRFQSLPAPEPNPRWLYFYLCTCNRTCPPGLIANLGARGLVEELGWTWEEDGAEAWTQLKVSGLIMANEAARVLYLPGLLEVNPPHNTNMLKGWAEYHNRAPECWPRTLWYRALARVVQARIEKNPTAAWAAIFSLFEEPQASLKVVSA